MIINHNMASLNTYRQMSTNMANSSKSLEKLSSGLRINKAGDDAAGLAISEKMRGQIRGLDQAARNGQDGISMLNTAEGALGETHSILQRMKELATQSANDTNTGSDRSEIQKEMNQLTSEVNRIGNTTEFNTQKLLQGSNSKSDVGASAAAGTSAVDSVSAVKAQWTTGTLDAVSADSTGNTISFMGATVTVNYATGAPVAAAATDGTTGSVTIDYAGGADNTADEQALKIVAAFDAIKTQAGSPLADFTFATDGAGKLVITGPASAGAANNSQAVTSTGAVTSSAVLNQAATVQGVTAVAGVSQTYDLTFDKVPTEGSTVSVAGKDVAFYDSSKGTYSDAADATTKFAADYVIDIKGKNTSDIAAAVAGLNYTNSGNGATATAVGNKVTFKAETTGATAADNAKVTTTDAYKGSTSVYKAGTAADANASGDTFTMTVVVGSKAFTVDTSTNGLARNYTGTDTYGSADQTAVLDTLKKATAADGTKLSDVLNISFENGTNQNLKLESKEVGIDNINMVLTGTTNNVTSALGVASANVTGTAGTAAYADGGKAFEATFQVGANTAQSMTIEVNDMRANALKISGDTASGSVKASNGSVATLKATKDVTNGTNNTTTEYALDVSTHEKATAAISVLDDAIQSVSAERSKIGAYTNRLDHTITNLGTSSENLTAAESRVRDVDMAKEMMQFQKNNILSQAAQAMMAQANQQPQGVLQLLR